MILHEFENICITHFKISILPFGKAKKVILSILFWELSINPAVSDTFSEISTECLQIINQHVVLYLLHHNFLRTSFVTILSYCAEYFFSFKVSCIHVLPISCPLSVANIGKCKYPFALDTSWDQNYIVSQGISLEILGFQMAVAR